MTSHEQDSQMAEISDVNLASIVMKLVRVYHPNCIYLFGSKARGTDDKDSDYDILIIVPDDAVPKRRRSRLAYESLRGTGIGSDILVWTKSGFEHRLHIPSSLPATVTREGIVLYGA
jgi:predicted nucleotidyltransferase